ncbi:MAG TPA: hypothetical protein VGL94_19980 [Ktedonobacteraceae bacterium]|jgi:hypothetical protein
MSKQVSGQRQPVRQTQRRERREEIRRRDQEQIATKRKRNIIIAGIIAGVVIIGAVVGTIALFGGLSPSTNNNISTTGTSQVAPPIGNVQCNVNEQLAFHIHAHLSMYIDGQNVPLPAQIGITNTCYYWLHTHDTSGIIHMESPIQTTFTLGTFLQLWRQQFSQLQYQNQLSSTEGWKVYIDGKPYTGDFNKIALQAHELITLAYNSPNVKPDTVFNWGQL